jgi:anti-sigma factor RsiW
MFNRHGRIKTESRAPTAGAQTRIFEGKNLTMARKFFRRRFYLPCMAAQRHLLSPYLDGELDAERRAQVAAHLNACAQCRAEFENLRFAARAVAHFQIPTASRHAPDAALMFSLQCDGEKRRDAPRMRADDLSLRSLHLIAHARRGGFASAIRGIFASSISIPTPLAIAALFVTFASIAFAAWFAAHRTAAAPALIAAPPRVIEIPVERETVRESVVTRRIYVALTRAPAKRQRQSPNFNQPNEPRHPAQEMNGVNLAGFRPAADANLRIVKTPEQ